MPTLRSQQYAMALIVACFGGSPAAADLVHWQSLLLDGRNVGYSQFSEEQRGDRIYRDYQAELQLIQQGSGESLRIELWEVESAAATPIKLRWRASAGRHRTTVNAWLDGERLRGVRQTALARANQIPTRVVAGIAYASRFVTDGPEFGPHMWVQVWDRGRWRSYDAGFVRFGAGHIALAYGDGAPQTYAAVAQLIRQLRIVDAGSLPER